MKIIRKRLDYSDLQLKIAYEAYKSSIDPEIGFILMPFSLSFLASQVANLSICPIDFQYRILEIQNQLNFWNAEVDGAMSCLEKTYDSSITGESRKVLSKNLESSYNNLDLRSKSIITLISKFLEAYPQRNR